jgi:predicted dehydrogenase
MNVLIYGAGSIGNHMAFACRSKKMRVTVCDTDSVALSRMRDEIYPMRYGLWDNSIIQVNQDSDLLPQSFDLIIVGTPPANHMSILESCQKFKPRAILVEKPFTVPNDLSVARRLERCSKLGISVFCGYNLSVGACVNKATNLIESGVLGEILSIEVDIREHWGGIFGAHPWLDGPSDSYLGSSANGGGAASEHSHGIHLLLYFAKLCGVKLNKEDAVTSVVMDSSGSYDQIASVSWAFQGKFFRVTQDVLTCPSSKTFRILGSRGALVGIFNFSGNNDLLTHSTYSGTKVNTNEYVFEKKRADDFIVEIEYIIKNYDRSIENNKTDGSLHWSPLSARLALQVQDIIDLIARNF